MLTLLVKVFICSLISLVPVFTVSLPSPRVEEFAKIQRYELVYFNTESFKSAHTIEFNAFETNYQVQLVPNHDMIASNIRHANVNPITVSSNPDHDSYFTSLKQTCHYFGHLLNTNKSSKVSLSLCNKRGIRGRIVTSNGTLIIQPSAYYLDHNKDKYGSHHINDQHLVYRLSDLNSSIVSEHDTHTDPHPHSPMDDIPSKRRMLQNNGVSNVELLIINDAFRTQQYIHDYGDQWYEQLVADYADIVNTAQRKILCQHWGKKLNLDDFGDDFAK
eukprot:510681_1